MKKIVIGIDIGGTNTKFGLVDQKGRIIARGHIRTNEYDTFELFLTELVNVVKEKAEKYKDDYKIAGYGVGVPNGNYFSGMVKDAPNLKWKEEINFIEQLENLTGVKSYITNDANAAAIGEKLFGKAKDMNDFIVITLGTGLGSGIYCGGKLLYGSTGLAGEIGHIIVKEEGRLCGCGRKGCLETYASATGIVNTVLKKLKREERKSILRQIHKRKIESVDIYEAALKGDELALEAFEFTGRILGKALANVVAVTSPEAIFLTGGLSKAGDIIFKPAIRYFENELFNSLKGTVKILESGLKGSDAAVLGAAALCWNELSK
ncbi:MAG: ROK family protein [Ignavibacteria bacterium]|nr:ROK family protein [Ignavibacteria bacterium]